MPEFEVYTSQEEVVRIISDVLAASFIDRGYTFEDALATAPQELQDNPDDVAIFRASWDRRLAALAEDHGDADS